MNIDEIKKISLESAHQKARAKEAQDELIAIDVYEKIIEEIKSRARCGEFEFEYEMGDNHASFFGFYSRPANHLKIVRNRLIKEGFKVSIYEYGVLHTLYYMKISWR